MICKIGSIQLTPVILEVTDWNSEGRSRRCRGCCDPSLAQHWAQSSWHRWGCARVCRWIRTVRTQRGGGKALSLQQGFFGVSDIKEVRTAWSHQKAGTSPHQPRHHFPDTVHLITGLASQKQPLSALQKIALPRGKQRSAGEGHKFQL